MGSEFRDECWQEVLAAGVLVGAGEVAAIAAAVGVTPETVLRVLDDARAAGLVVDGRVDADAGAALVDALDPARYAAIHADAARFYASGDPDDKVRALTFARRGAGALRHDELVELTDAAARALSERGRFADAVALFVEADGLDPVRASADRARRLLRWAAATEYDGDRTTAQRLRHRSFEIAQAAADGRAMTAATLAYCLPADWRDGDDTALRMVQAAEAVVTVDADRARLLAVRAMLSMRVPTVPGAAAQVAWVTQPMVAQPLADEAVKLATGTEDDAEVVALLAWRSTHRAPQFLDRRWEVSQEAVELGQSLARPELLVNAAVWGAVDAIERADAAGMDRMVSVARWTAERSRQPRALWHAHLLQAGQAHLAGQPQAADLHRREAFRIGSSIDEPGTYAAQMFLICQAALDRDDPDELAGLGVDEEHLLLASPLARAVHGLIQARAGAVAVAARDLGVAMRGLDDESSVLLAMVLCSRVALRIDDVAAMTNLAERLRPWSGHVAVDAMGWWCGGPVSLTLAELDHRLGAPDQARDLAAAAAFTAERLGDVRSQQQAQALWAAIGARLTTTASNRLDVLTDRERTVLAFVARGETNSTIASRLNFSLATVRRDTITIYRKLGVNGRVEATAVALSEGLLNDPDGPGDPGNPDRSAVSTYESARDRNRA